MRNSVKLAAGFLAVVSIESATALPNSFQSQAELESELRFLTGSLLFEGSGDFQTIKAKLPRSYYSNNIEYWGDYVCTGADCYVTDAVFYPPYAIAPEDPASAGGQLQEERVFAVTAADIYDASTWQIALALGAANTLGLSTADAAIYINNENKRLNRVDSRAANGDFLYGYGNTASSIENPKYAYALWNQSERLSRANNVINVMLYGGDLPQGGVTLGLIEYFKQYAWHGNANEFYQGGQYVDGAFTATLEPYALDVNTWRVTALGPKTVDTWFGQAASFNIWRVAKEKSGYIGKDGDLWGVGYTDQRESEERVLSGEWTAGAINMVHMLIQYYENNAGISEQELAELQADEASMLEGLLALSSERYEQKNFSNDGGLPAQYKTLLATNETAIYYASRRYEIPFGWFANPLPSTASTAWTMMLSYWYNPFGYKGSMVSPDFKDVPSYDAHDPELFMPVNIVTVVKAIDQPIVAMSYNTEASPDNWIPLSDLPDGEWADINIPSKGKTLGVAFNVDDVWYPACSLDLTATHVQEKLQGDPLHTVLIADWVEDKNNPGSGGGECRFKS